jgi:hypothetical protein
MPKRLASAQASTAEKSPFLCEARERFKYSYERWRDIREQHDVDMKFRACDTWDEREKAQRKKLHMPMLELDKLSQYLNQVVNDVRQNKRAVSVLPKGAGANDKTAELRADWIRGVEYISQAQTAYVTAFEGMVGASYGFCKLETFYESAKSFNLSAKIVPIVNANTILYDPDCKYYDCSDADDCFEIDFISHDSFKRKYPRAEIKIFADDIQAVAPDWIKPKQVQVASWWRVVREDIELHLVDIDHGDTRVMRSDQLPDKFDAKRILKSRDYCDRRIVQYVLNGVEVLETNDPRKGKGWPGQWIPIIPFWGQELFVDEGSGSVRKLFSLIRRARDPQRALNYYASQEMAEAKMSPRSPLMGPRGMFSQQWKDWEELNEVPKAAVEYDVPEGFQPGSVEPKRVPFIPNFQSYAVLKDSYDRAIMEAMGISPLPTAAQRANEKSGVALERIQGERAVGSYHFIDNFERSITYVGRQLDDLYDRIVDTARDIPARAEDGTHYVARVKDPANSKNKQDAGEHDVTIIVGPSDSSQREEVAKFADTLAQIQGVFPLIGDLIVRMRNLGPIGNQIADRLTPPQFAQKEGAEPLPAAAQAQIAQAQQQIQAMQEVIAQLQQEKAAKMLDGEVKLKIAAMQEQTKLVVAQASLQRDQAETILQNEMEKIQAIFDAAHDHSTIAHEAEQQRATAAHAASLPQPAATAAASTSNGGGGIS